MVDCEDIVNLSHDELVEEYHNLFGRFKELRESNERDTQKIHELKRSLDTALAAQNYLSQELEQYTNCDNIEMEKDLYKVQAELNDVKKKYEKLKTSFTSLQQDYALLLDENSKLSKQIETVKRNESLPGEDNAKIVDDYILRIQVLENENMDLLQKIEDFEQRSVRYTLTIAESEKKIEILRDQIMCLEENLQSKRLDLEEKLQMLESVQEQLVEANAKIAILSASPDNGNRKGNSLFAEVDDQRQAMKKLLTAQKKSYMEMKKIYNESEHEIRRLKRENISMHTELETCSAIFCNADKIYQEKLNERIRNLLNQNENLEHKLKWTQERLKDLANNKGVLFCDSLLNFCKRETEDLKAQLHSVRIQKASLEEQLRNAQQDMARWRFESLKSRCVLVNRENLLTENKITFKPIHALEYSISEKDQAEAKPRIFSNRRSSIFKNVMESPTAPVVVKNEESLVENCVLITPNKNKEKRLELDVNEVGPEEAKPGNFIDGERLTPLELATNQDSLHDSSISQTSKIKKECKLGKNINLADISSKTEEGISKKLLPNIEMQTIAEKNKKSIDADKIKLNNSLKQLKNKKINDDKENNNVINDTDDNPRRGNFAKLKFKPASPMRPSERSWDKSTLKMSTPPARSILNKSNDTLFKESYKNVKFSSDADTVYNISLDTSSSSTSTDSFQIDAVKKTCSKPNIVVRRVIINSKHN